MSSRTARIIGYGGDPGSKVVSAVMTSWNTGSDYAKDFQDWASSVPDYPSPVGLRLYPVAGFFSGEQAALLHEAYLAYASAQISIQAVRRPPPFLSIEWGGKALPMPDYTNNSACWVIIDRITGNPLVIPGAWASDVPDAVKVWQGKQVLVVFCCRVGLAGVGWGGGRKPSDAVVSFLKACGAGEALDQVLAWRGWHEQVYGTGHYCLVGAMGSGARTGIEAQNLTVVDPRELDIDVPVIPVWDGHKSVYTVLDW
jgi:hypothetical protein